MIYDQPHILIEKALLLNDPIPELINLLNNEHTLIEAALNLSEIKDDRSIEPLFLKFKEKIIPELSYSLTQFNCSTYISQLIPLAINSNQEIQQHIIEIINNSILNNEKILSIEHFLESEKDNVNSIKNYQFFKSLFKIYKENKSNCIKIK